MGNRSYPLGNRAHPVGNRGYPLGYLGNPLGNCAYPVGNRGNPVGNHAYPRGIRHSPRFARPPRVFRPAYPQQLTPLRRSLRAQPPEVDGVTLNAVAGAGEATGAGLPAPPHRRPVAGGVAPGRPPTRLVRDRRLGPFPMAKSATRKPTVTHDASWEG